MLLRSKKSPIHVEQGADLSGTIAALLGLFFLMIQGLGNLFWESRFGNLLALQGYLMGN